MLNKEELLKKVDEKYIDMLKQVNIPDFTKCIAQFSGLHISKVNDKVIEQYLITWAVNKYRFYKMLGNKIKIDNNVSYKEEQQDNKVEDTLSELEKDFPTYALWLDGFKYIKNNKIQNNEIYIETKNMIKKVFPLCHIEGCTLTHFFKSYLAAPDDLVTKIGKIWENQEIEGKYTISIDPIDMMLASENPYSWDSCYRLENGNESSHADGCLAAVLDNSSLITYIWNREGKFSLYNKYDFKNIRYYRMREWISISPMENAIHFNDIYPGKFYTEDFEKLLRKIVEDLVDKDATWIMNENYDMECIRQNCYGYSEFHSDNIFKIKDSEDTSWTVYNEEILCPCGCGEFLPGSDNEYCNGIVYNGWGFIAENYYERFWCEIADEYCENDEDCENCVYWNRCHPVCEYDESIECSYSIEAEGEGNFNPYDNNIVFCGGHCYECSYYEEHNNQEEDEDK